MFGTALIGTAANETKAAAVRLARYTAVYAVAAGLFITSLVYAAGAAYLQLSYIFGSINAGLMLSAGFMLLAVIAFLCIHIINNKNKVETQTRVKSEAGSLATVAAISALPAFLRRRSFANSASLVLPLAIAGGMFLWAKSSDGTLNDLKKYFPNLFSPEE